MRWRKVVLALAGVALSAGAVAIGVLRLRKNPSACPYEQRSWSQLPRPFITPDQLEILSPRRGERILEIGPGTGHYSLHVAEWLAPDGALAILDLQQKMLDHTMRQARERGIINICATRGDATALPYPDDSFDAAYLVTTLGEIRDQGDALREMPRVIEPGGRLVVGEILLDPDWVSPGKLVAQAEGEGLRLESRVGRAFAYFARFAA